MTRWDLPRLCVVAGAFLLALSLMAHARRGIPPWALPATPFDRTNPELADEWQFLREAIQHIPPGASYTVVAPHRETAMSVFMFSRALLPDRVARPTSYWDAATPDVGATAEFVLAYRCAPEAEPGLLVVARLESGVVAIRQRRVP